MKKIICVKKRSIVIITALILTVTTFVFSIGALGVKATFSEEGKIKIVLDAGHGGIDGGVSGTYSKVKESEINLAITKKLQTHLENAGFYVVLTRKDEQALYGIATSSLKERDMENRRKIIEEVKPDMVISIHQNKFGNPSVRGGQVFYKKGDVLGKSLADSIQTEFNGMETSKRKLSALIGDYFMLNCSNYPSALCECGFLSNAEEESLLITDAYQETVAYTIYKGIIAYLSENAMVFCD